jgi:hypothetical protein
VFGDAQMADLVDATPCVLTKYQLGDLVQQRPHQDQSTAPHPTLKLLGLRHRRGHDLRRTMISLARTDGARKDILALCTTRRRITRKKEWRRRESNR